MCLEEWYVKNEKKVLAMNGCESWNGISIIVLKELRERKEDGNGCA